MAKCGNVRRAKPYGMRLPSTFCWPTHAMICEMLMSLPFEPAMTIALTLLVSSITSCTLRPAFWRAELSTRLTMFSNESTMVRPGCVSSSPF